nr:FCD domain-containing protein [Gemmatimonadota bacterium]NIR78014.1 FCD domain-containing protein [Gemmatimonadota bacterium]NIT86550.1 FCD domain-containing protein [Gemmatimonadota bacterium]NIU30412.1 FCD domain-containing protein [Gemmatimonadota bacterium]NIU35287.1 FCD domain-containing protein [Gemmatimonadota bacterium]
LISEASGNERLADLLEDFRTQLRRLESWYYSYPEHTRKSVREHDALIDALRTGELDKALAIFERNMSLTMTTLLAETGRDQDGMPTMPPLELVVDGTGGSDE